MKRLFTLLSLLLISSAALLAQGPVISGVLTNGSTNLPMAGQNVYAVDSNPTLSWTLSATTNANGYYAVTIPSGTPVNSTIMVYTMACGATPVQTFTYNNQSILANFTLCNSSPANPVLKGFVTVGSSTQNGTKVYLIRKQYDSLLSTWTLTALDSTTTNGNGYYSFTPGAIPAGNLLVKAALPPGAANYTSYLPTYHTNSLIWSSATSVPSTAWTTNTNVNISLIAGTNTGGPGFVGGSVLQGANKQTGVGDPLASRILILKTSTGTPVAYTYSGLNGSFSFPNVPLGSYKIHGDAGGKLNPELSFTLTAAAPSIANIVFAENSTKFEGHLGGLSNSNVAAAMPLRMLYPNPFRDVLYVHYTDATHITLLNATGSVVIDRDIRGEAEIPVSQLASGLYLARIQTSSGIEQIMLSK